MVVDPTSVAVVEKLTMENGSSPANSNNSSSLSPTPNGQTPPSPPTATGLPSNGGGLCSRSPSSLNLKNIRSAEEAGRSVAAYAHQQAALLAPMFAQRFIHVANQTAVDVETLHSQFLGEFIPAFLESLHASLASPAPMDCCDMCCELGQRASFLATCQSSLPAPQQQQASSFQQRSNSVSFGTKGKNSPPHSVQGDNNSPCNPSLLASSLHNASIYSLNKASHGNGSAVGSKLKNFLGQFVRRRTISSTSNNRDGNILPPNDPHQNLSSPSLSLPVDVVLEGILELHTRAPGSSTNGNHNRSGLSSSRDLLTSIPQQSELERDDDEDESAHSDATSNHTVDIMSKSTEHLSDSPWQPCLARLLRSAAGPLLVLSYASDSQPPCGISLSSISEVRAATIGDALTTDDHAFILISSSLSCRVLLKAPSRAEMNRWLDVLRPCVSFHPAPMVPLFPVNKFGLSVPSPQNQTTNLSRFSAGGLMGNLPSPQHIAEPSTPKSGAADNLARSTSFVGRRRIQTSPAVDLQHLFTKNHKTQKTPDSETSPTSAAASEVSGSSRTNSSEATSVATPPRSLSPNSTQQQQQQQRPLSTFPWYWGNISRNEAAEIVCKFGESGTGCFVIRQSESQQGDYVVTFNCEGEAKHLRLKVYTDGRCQMNQYAFTSVQALVDHFRTNALPIDLGNDSDSSGVMLTNYVSKRPTTPSNNNNNNRT